MSFSLKWRQYQHLTVEKGREGDNGKGGGWRRERRKESGIEGRRMEGWREEESEGRGREGMEGGMEY